MSGRPSSSTCDSPVGSVTSHPGASSAWLGEGRFHQQEPRLEDARVELRAAQMSGFHWLGRRYAVEEFLEAREEVEDL